MVDKDANGRRVVAVGSGTFCVEASRKEGTLPVQSRLKAVIDALGAVTDTVTVSVMLGATTTALTASAASVAVGSSVAFAATVTGASGVPAPTGIVTLQERHDYAWHRNA